MSGSSHRRRSVVGARLRAIMRFESHLSPASRLLQIGFFMSGVTAAVALSGCGRSAESTGALPSQTLRLSQRNEPADLDPATANLPDDFFVIRALAEGLLVPSPDGEAPRPGAAERFTVSSDGLTYTFFL